MALMIALNEAGYRIGQYHHNATLTDRDVELMLRLRADGYGWKRLARTFDCGVRTVRDVCAGTRRAQVPASWRMIRAAQDGKGAK